MSTQEASRKYYQANKAKIIAKNKESRQLNKAENNSSHATLVHNRAQAQKTFYQKNKDAVKAKAKEWRQNNKERKTAKDVAWQKLNWKKTTVFRIKSRCKRNNIPFNLTPEDIFVPMLCPILRVPLGVPLEKFNDRTPTVDRIDPNGGYVRGNVQVISWKANRLKCDGSLQELMLLGDWASRQQGV